MRRFGAGLVAVSLALTSCSGDALGPNGSVCVYIHAGGQGGTCAQPTAILVGPGQTLNVVVDASGKSASGTAVVVVDTAALDPGVTVSPTRATIQIPGQLSMTLSLAENATFNRRSITFLILQPDSTSESHVTLSLIPLQIGSACDQILSFGNAGVLTMTAGSVNVDTTRWSSSDTSVMTAAPGIGPATTLTAHGNGTAIIKAHLGTGLATETCHVTQTPANLTVSPPNIGILNVGQSIQVAARITDRNGNVMNWPVTWASENDAASVTSTGLVTARQHGLGQIRVTATGTNLNIEMQFNVP